MRTKYLYGFSDKRNDDINKSVGFHLPSISKCVDKTVWRRTKSVPTVNTADANFEQIDKINDNDIKNTYFHIRVILKTVKKKMLK